LEDPFGGVGYGLLGLLFPPELRIYYYAEVFKTFYLLDDFSTRGGASAFCRLVAWSTTDLLISKLELWSLLHSNPPITERVLGFLVYHYFEQVSVVEDI
jgi:hypothetical protein